VMKKFSNISKL